MGLAEDTLALLIQQIKDRAEALDPPDRGVLEEIGDETKGGGLVTWQDGRQNRRGRSWTVDQWLRTVLGGLAAWAEAYPRLVAAAVSSSSPFTGLVEAPFDLSYTLPANDLGEGSLVEITVLVQVTAGAPGRNLLLRGAINGTPQGSQFAFPSPAAGDHVAITYSTLFRGSGTSSEAHWFMRATYGGATLYTEDGNGTFDLTQDLLFELYAQWGGPGTLSATLERFEIRVSNACQCLTS